MSTTAAKKKRLRSQNELTPLQKKYRKRGAAAVAGVTGLNVAAIGGVLKKTKMDTPEAYAKLEKYIEGPYARHLYGKASPHDPSGRWTASRNLMTADDAAGLDALQNKRIHIRRVFPVISSAAIGQNNKGMIQIGGSNRAGVLAHEAGHLKQGVRSPTKLAEFTQKALYHRADKTSAGLAALGAGLYGYGSSKKNKGTRKGKAARIAGGASFLGSLAPAAYKAGIESDASIRGYNIAKKAGVAVSKIQLAMSPLSHATAALAAPVAAGTYMAYRRAMNKKAKAGK